MTQHNRLVTDFQIARFGRRKIAPRVCIADSKPHIRKFLADALEEIGFIAEQCPKASDLPTALGDSVPDLVVTGLSDGGDEGAALLDSLAANAFEGKVLLLGPRDSLVVAAVREIGEQLGLTMLPTLLTPFDSEALHRSVATLLPREGPPNPVIDAAEALKAGWLELWYQPKFSTRTLQMSGVEALLRVRHPTWGVVPPAYFLPDKDDPQLCTLSDFVISRAIYDCGSFFADHPNLEVALNLPFTFLQNPLSVVNLCRKVTNQPILKGLIIEVDAADALSNLDLLKATAKQLRFGNIALAIDDIGSEWHALIGLDELPCVELKVDRPFINGVADDRFKQSVCRHVLDVADRFGARTVAEGVETRADFFAVRELGFDLAQGFLLGKPMTAQRLAMTAARHPAFPQ